MTSCDRLRELVVAPFGAPASAALARLLLAAKGGDPLAPVTVACPSSYAAVALRRQLGGRSGGVVNVRFVTLPEVAELLGGPALARQGRRPATAAVRLAAIRAELAAAPGVFAHGAGHAATEQALDAALRQLDGLPPATRLRVAATGPVAADTVRLHAAVRARLAGYYGESDASEAAASAVNEGDVAGGEVGTLLLHLPRRLSAAELALVGALADHVGAAAVVGTSGPDDPVAGRLVAQLAPTLGSPSPPAPDGVEQAPSGPRPRPPVTTLVSAPDPEEEVRGAVRHLLERAGAGVPLHRMAVVWRLAEPYALLVHEQLRAAGLPFHGPAPASLAQSVAGRTLLGALALGDSDLRRADVLAWMSGSPVLDHGGRPVPAPRWESLSRRAGVVAGRRQWRHRLEALRRSQAHALAKVDPADEAARARLERETEEIDRLDGFVAELADAVLPPSAAEWRDYAAWAAGLLQRAVGPPHRCRHWPDDEVSAYQQVLAALEGLATLHGVAPCPGAPAFRRALEQELGAPAASAGFFGGGVFTGSLADALGADFDTVAIVGMVEGGFPPPTGDDAILPEQARAAVEGLLPNRVERQAEEHRAYVAALAGGAHRRLSYPRADPRGQRRTLPCRWLLEEAAELAGRHVTADDVDTLAAEPWYRFDASFESAVRQAATPTSLQELDTQLLLQLPAGASGAGGAGGTGGHPVLAALPRLARGFEAARARRGAVPTSWEGFVGDMAGLSPSAQPRSATSLQTWVRCPFRYFLAQVLRVGELDEPETADTITPIDRGSLVHEILERFVAGATCRRPDQPWGPDDRRRLHDVADDVLDRYESEGRTGRALLWRAEQQRIRRDLDRFLESDSDWRSRSGMTPAAVELAFGFDGDPVSVTLPTGQELAFRGFIDRLDADPASGRVVVLDYKTGSARDYGELAPGGGTPVDLVCRGRHLQLPVYALAAAARHPGATVESYFWFVSEGGRFEQRGGVFDAEANARFLDVLEVIVDGVRQGVFAARPGRRDRYFDTFDQCRTCPYDRVCPRDRDDRWAELRAAPGLSRYVSLVEPDEVASP